MTNSKPKHIGMIVPSSNTVLEPELCRLAALDRGVTVHVARVRVTEVSLSMRASAQFDVRPMREAASLLGDAGLDSIAWAGTSGAWLGVGHDRQIVEAVGSATGAPATTSTLAMLEACRSSGIERVALVTPYTDEVVARIIANLFSEGIEVVAEQHLGLTDNRSFGQVAPAVICGLASGFSGSGAQALVVLCTNLRAAPLLAELHQLCGLPVLDSVVVTLAHCLAAAGADTDLSADSGRAAS